MVGTMRTPVALAILLLTVGAGRADAPAAATPGSAPAGGGVRARGPGGASLTVVVNGVVERRGELLVTVFTSADGWPKPGRAAAAARVAAIGATQEVRFEGLPVGPCAVSVVHDLDGNGRLTMRWFPFPHPGEPTGASNGATGSLGPPSFERARFELGPDGATIPVTLSPP
jgi:uncharacterized protein (DUF2141 family)